MDGRVDGVEAPTILRSLLADGVVAIVPREQELLRDNSPAAKEARQAQLNVIRRAESHLRELVKDAEFRPKLPETKRIRYQPGDLVRTWLGHSLSEDPLVLNARLSAHRWSAPWRVLSVSADGADLDLTLAEDPLQTERVSWMQVKPTRVSPEHRQQIENLFERSMAQKKVLAERKELARAKMSWVYEEVPESNKVEVETVVRTQGRGPKAKVLVKFVGFEKPEWLLLKRFAVDAPAAWLEFKTRNGVQTRRAARP